MKVLLATGIDAVWTQPIRSDWDALVARDRFGVHEIVEDPESADVVLFIDAHQYPSDWTMRMLRNHELVRAYPEKAFVYDERDFPRDLLPGIYVAMPRRAFDPRRHRAFGYYRLVSDTSVARNWSPDLLFSFQGRRSGRVRERVLALAHPRAILEDTSELDFFSQAGVGLEEARARYVDVVGRSKFVLCPRGAGTSSIRLFEALAAARVPVVISDAWVPPPGIDWEACSVRVCEADVPTIGELLEALEEEWPRLSAVAASIYDEWFAPDVWFHRVVELCGEIRAEGTLGPVRPWFQLRTWRAGARAYRGRRAAPRP